MSRWLLAILVLTPASGVVAACGDEKLDPPPPKVRLAITSPSDTAVVEGDEVEISGSVVPAQASIAILGKPVDASSGRFSTTVDLDPGANVIDVAASAAGRRPVVTAVRIVRELPVQVPDVSGERPDTAVQKLEALGLQVSLHEGGGLLDDLFGGDPRVCGTDPAAGETVKPGTTVAVEVQRAC